MESKVFHEAFVFKEVEMILILVSAWCDRGAIGRRVRQTAMIKVFCASSQRVVGWTLHFC